MLIAPEKITDLVGLGILVGIGIFQRLREPAHKSVPKERKGGID
jgi:hypothetical protein